MGTRCLSRRRIYGSVMWLICVITNVLCMERFLEFESLGEASEVGDGKGSLRFEDWSRVVVTEQSSKWRQNLAHRNLSSFREDHEPLVKIHGNEQIHKVAMEDDRLNEREHRIARDSLQQWLTPADKWHFVIGYTNVRAFSAARRFTQGEPVHHFPTRNCSVQFFLTFISAALAEVMRDRPLFHVVEPLLSFLKIEDLTLGKLIRDQEGAKQEPKNSLEEPLALKATLAHNALSLREVKSLAERWEVALQLESQDALLSHDHTTTLRYTDTGGQMGIHPVGEERGMSKTDLQLQPASVIKCQVSVTAIVCSPITKAALQGAANFMASHAVVQLVELNPRYEVFNKWAKYVTQHCFFRDKYQPVPFNAVNLQARKVVQYVISWGDKTDFAGGHGTHVAGSIAGDTEEGSNEFAGMAPAAKIAFFDLGSNSSNLRTPIELGKGVFDYGYMAGARIFSNSWGVLRQGYSSNSHEVDSFSYLNEDVLIIFAVGNQGTLGKGTVASPASSKNCLAVGASFNAAASLASQREDYSRHLMKPSTVAPFSSAGPTIDGRIKPDVLAPGMVVWSSLPDLGHGPPEQNCQVGPKQGTSSSTPVVAGLAALARQYFREGYYPSGKKNPKDGFIPSGALLKAVMIHSAVPEHIYVNSSGMNDLQLAPDYVQGFGLVVMEKVLVFAKPRSKHQPSNLIVLSEQIDGAVAKHKTLQTFTLRVTSSKEPLRMTMVWMDPPAAPSSLHPMVNDLNLKVQGPNNKTIYPNGMKEEDSINNVEVIHVMKPKKGRWRVTVEGARVVNDRQPYALVVTGGFRSKGTRSGFRGAGYRNGYYNDTSDDISAAVRQASPHWQYNNFLCIFLGTFCSVIVMFPLLKINRYAQC